MSSPGQKCGTCHHVLALFDGHTRCARCREEGQQGSDPCVLHLDCSFCCALTPEQVQQLAIPMYQLRKENKCKGNNNVDLVDPSSVTVIFCCFC